MIVYSTVDVKQVATEGKKYRWERPGQCGKCNHSILWGHGHVERYFDGFMEALWIKRWRCPLCGAVHTMRPEGYWRKFQATCTDIVKSLKGKIEHGRWLDKTSRQRQQYWWKGFKKQVVRLKGLMVDSLVQELEQLLISRIVIASHSTNQCEVTGTG
jgi:hypothetical protein